MKVGLGHLRHPPAVFWAMTPRELFAAIEGYTENKGGGGNAKPVLMSEEEVDELFALTDAIIRNDG